MPRSRRIRFVLTREGTVEIDYDKLTKFNGLDRESDPKKVELALHNPIAAADVSIDEMASLIGRGGTYDRFADTALDVVIEELCPKHQQWYELSEVKKQRQCWQCQSEARPQPKEKDDDKNK